MPDVQGSGTAEDPWVLNTPPGGSQYQVHRDEAADRHGRGWARSEDNPVGGWYGLRKGYRGRFANYVPPVLEALGLVELEHNPRNNRMRTL